MSTNRKSSAESTESLRRQKHRRRYRWQATIAFTICILIIIVTSFVFDSNRTTYELRPAGPLHLDMGLRHGDKPRSTPDVTGFTAQAQIAASGRVVLVAPNDDRLSVGLLFGEASVVGDDNWFQHVQADIGAQGLRIRHHQRVLEAGSQQLDYALLHFINPPAEIQALTPGSYLSFMGVQGRLHGENHTPGLLVVPQAVRIAGE